MAELYANNAQTTLASSATSGATTISVVSATAFPSGGNFRVLIDSEIMLVTGVSGTTFTVTRAQESTTAAAHGAGSTVTHVLTAASVQLVSIAAAQITSGQLGTSQMHRGAGILLCLGFTPAATGADVGEVMVPYDPADGTTSITWTVRRIWLRVNVAGGAPVAVVQKSTAGNAVFGSGTAVGTLTMVSGEYLVAVTSSLGTVASGDMLRFSVTTLGTATGWTIGIELGT